MGVTLRTRVVLAAGAAILLAVVAVGVAVSLLVAGHLRSSLDRDLRDRATEVARLSASAPAVLSTPGVLDARIGGQQLSVEVLDRRGRIVARSLALGGSLLPSAVARRVIASGRPQYAAGRLGDVHLRLYVAPLPTVGGSAAGGAVIVAASTSEFGETLDRLHTFTVLSGLGAVALAALAAFVLVRRALRPLGRLSSGAGEIERTADLGGRLPEPSTGDEVGRLALTLNRMLAALERAHEVERRFLADASHELRSPVTALRGNVDYLLRHGHDEAALADLAADAERLSTLIDDLLTLSREDAGGPPEEAVQLDELAIAAAAADPTDRRERSRAGGGARRSRRARAGDLEPGRERAVARAGRGDDHDRRRERRRPRPARCPRRGRRPDGRAGGARVRSVLACPPGLARLGTRAGDRPRDRRAARRPGHRGG